MEQKRLSLCHVPCALCLSISLTHGPLSKGDPDLKFRAGRWVVGWAKSWGEKKFDPLGFGHSKGYFAYNLVQLSPIKLLSANSVLYVLLIDNSAD
jgi:hypothetical protein